MNPNSTRRHFLQTTALAGAALATGPALNLAAAGEGPIVLALVGGAHIHTPGFIDLLKGRRDVQVKYAWDHDRARAAKRAQSLGCPAVDDLAVIWNDPAVVGVVICSETNRHPALVAAATRARKHLFVEKPLGFTARESRSMAEAITKSGRHFTTGYFMRTDPKHLFLKQQVAAGAFGRITRVNGWNCHSGSLGGWFDTEWRWMADPKQAGVGAFGDLGTHSLDIMMWLMGDVVEATATVAVVTGRYGSCDETGQGLMKFRNGVSGTLTAGWVDVANPVTLEIAGTEGHALIVNDALYFQSKHVEGADGKQPWTKLPPALRVPMHQWVDAIAGRTEGVALVTPAEAAARVAAMEAMYAGARSERWVKVS